jgi:hypothetical protein
VNTASIAVKSTKSPSLIFTMYLPNDTYSLGLTFSNPVCSGFTGSGIADWALDAVAVLLPDNGGSESKIWPNAMLGTDAAVADEPVAGAATARLAADASSRTMGKARFAISASRARR